MAALDLLHASEAAEVFGPTPAEIRAAALNEAYADATTHELLAASIRHEFVGRVAVVSSFGAESAVLLHLIAAVDPATPVLFVDTDKLFGETLRYRDKLIKQFGLTNVRTLAPDPARVAAIDPKGGLWASNPDMCCRIRKVEPLAAGLDGFEAWISGRKRYQAATRATLLPFEAEGGRIKINPLANWQATDLQAYADRHGLPAHPLVAQGYLSIGCMPCTDPVAPGDDIRSGRWRGQDKTECGIHMGGLIQSAEAEGSGI
jgi:phosphoadenosine phosphosulfate reductase